MVQMGSKQNRYVIVSGFLAKYRGAICQIWYKNPDARVMETRLQQGLTS